MNYAAFLYGVNIPNGKRISPSQVEELVAPLPQAIRFVRFVDDADNLLFQATGVGNVPARLSLHLESSLDVKSVVLSIDELAGIVTAAKKFLAQKDYPGAAPYRFVRANEPWEIGVVLASNQLSDKFISDGGLFRKTKNAIALMILGRRALLVEKRVCTSPGTRIMFGKTVIKPWRMVLESEAVNVHCITSRSLGTLEKVSTIGGDL
jgi:uncharacterized protein (DUF1697 family)